MGENELQLIKDRVKKDIRWYIWVFGILFIIIMAGSNILASKIFYENNIQKLQQDIIKQELRIIKLEDAYYTTTYNLSRLCEKEGIDYKQFPIK